MGAAGIPSTSRCRNAKGAVRSPVTLVHHPHLATAPRPTSQDLFSTGVCPFLIKSVDVPYRPPHSRRFDSPPPALPQKHHLLDPRVAKVGQAASTIWGKTLADVRSQVSWNYSIASTESQRTASHPFSAVRGAASFPSIIPRSPFTLPTSNTVPNLLLLFRSEGTPKTLALFKPETYPFLFLFYPFQRYRFFFLGRHWAGCVCSVSTSRRPTFLQLNSGREACLESE
ncbi:hypothetical protein QBC44DRAFT_52123 [Cladorrhinum sp. PSN332]|nr:hypothetical protein QBC44DRAFT_52123 [Cladorrhinum sp. PSN332]